MSYSAYAQDVLRIPPYSEVQESLVEQIEADTTANGERIPGRIYELDGGAIYLNMDTFYVEDGDTLHIRSNNGERPIIYMYPTGSGSNPQNPPGYMLRSRGGDIILENLAITGYDELSDNPATGVFDQLYTVQGGLFRTDSEGGSFTFKGNVFSNIAGQILRTDHSTGTIHVEDNIFANLGALSTSNFGAGKGIDLRASSVESLIVVDNTFVNYQDRVIRHYNFGDPLAGTGNIEHGLIDHNTFVNGMGFHGVLSLGNVGAEMTITNNLFVDAFAGGEDSTDVTRSFEWGNTGETYANGNNRMSWIFAAPSAGTDWTVSNNFYALSSEGQAFIDSYDTVGVGSPLSLFIQGEIDNASTAFTEINDPMFTDAPALMTGMLTYYREVANRTKDTPNDVWDPATQDFDRKPITYFIDTFDASYISSSPAADGAIGGGQVGDRNWGTWTPDEEVLRIPPYAEVQQSLVEQIEADTTASGERVLGRVYELDGGAIYLNMDTYYVESGETLHIRSNNGERPIIYMYPSGSGSNPQNPPGYMLRSRGGDIILENLAITGYDELSDNPATGVFDQLYTVQGGLFRTDSEGGSFTFKGNVFSNIAGQILRTDHSTGTIHVEDNIFANLGALSTSNFGAGKGIDLRASSVESLIVVDNTFVNYQDRVIRHYNFGDPLAGTGNIEHGLIDHNTFVNGMGFHGVLSLGNVGAEMTITNNLFVDAFAGGEDSTDVTRSFEWGNTGETYANGNNRMSWIFAAPSAGTDWTVSNNFYALSSEGQAFIDSYDTVGVGSPLSLFIQGEIDNASTAFTEINDPMFTDAPALMTGMLTYYREVANRTKDTPNDVWDPATQDFDRKPITYFIDTFDASIDVNSSAATGAIGGGQVGDRNWGTWNPTSSEDETLLPVTMKLDQNYPNPFNPSTNISFTLPSSQKVTLRVYDMLGREVATLVNNQTVSAGAHTVNFDASSLSSGVYIYQLVGSNVSLTRRMTLIK